jgi:hypothetical protein
MNRVSRNWVEPCVIACYKEQVTISGKKDETCQVKVAISYSKFLTSFRSLKDKRASTKNPHMVTTLRYYCSQRSDTAKHRKPEHPKASNRYECAGALTVIIDLSKIAGYITLTHKDPHPPFISPSSNSAESRSQHSSQQQMLAQQRLQDKFDKLKVKALQFADLIDQQKTFHSKQFLNTATDAFQAADEMLIACSVFEVDPAPKNANKYTTHYRRRANIATNTINATGNSN